MITNKFILAKKAYVFTVDSIIPIELKAEEGPWNIEFKRFFVEICSNHFDNSIETTRTFIPHSQIRKIITIDNKKGEM